MSNQPTNIKKHFSSVYNVEKACRLSQLEEMKKYKRTKSVLLCVTQSTSEQIVLLPLLLSLFGQCKQYSGVLNCRSTRTRCYCYTQMSTKCIEYSGMMKLKAGRHLGGANRSACLQASKLQIDIPQYLAPVITATCKQAS